MMLAAVASAAPAALSVGGALQAVTNVTRWAHLATAMATSGTYTLAPGFSMVGYSGTFITVRSNVTVLGQGTVLDASKKGQFFDIGYGGSLTLKDLTLQHGFMVSGRRSMHAPHSHSQRGQAPAAWCCSGADSDL
jgi:hypothetical protein